MQKIHFKVALCHNNATVFRRFALENSASALYNPTSPNASIPFATLKCELISLFKSENLDKNFIVQYKDDESQWITFSSDEELAFAAKLMQNRLNLQLVPNTAQHHEPEKNRACGSDNVREQPPAKQIKKQEKQVAKKNAHLEQHRDKVTEKLTALKASENPKAAAKVEKLEQKLVAINAILVDVPKQPTVAQPPELDVAAKNAKPNDKEELPLNGHDRLVQHRDRIVEKISALQASQNPKHQAQVEQLQQKLVAVNTKLDAWIQAQKNKEAAKKANLEKRNAQKEALLKKREILSEKISVLKSRASDKPKDQAQLAKLEESVQAIDAKLLKLQPSEENKVAPAVAVEISAPISDKAIVPVDKTNTALSDAKAKHKALNNELQEYKTHIGSMTKFLKLLKKNPNQVDDTMIHQTENFLGLLQQAFSAKKVNISDQAGVMKMLMKAQAKKQAEIEKKKQNPQPGNDKKKGVEDKKSAPKKIVANPDSKIVKKQVAEQI